MHFPEMAPSSGTDRMKAIDMGRVPIHPVPVRVDRFMRITPRIPPKTDRHLGPVPGGIALDFLDEISRAAGKRPGSADRSVRLVGQCRDTDEPGVAVTKPFPSNVRSGGGLERRRRCGRKP